MLIKRMVFMQNTSISDGLINCFVLPEMPFIENLLHLNIFADKIRGFWLFVYILIAFVICLVPENNYKRKDSLSFPLMIIAAISFVWGFICLSGESVFVYFNF